MKERMKNQKGITLIALIITIVVLLILAVVAINSIENYGIISHAGNTANTYNKAVDDEKQQLQNYLDYLDKHNGGSKTYETYSIRDEVKVMADVDKNGVEEEHLFYVIENSDAQKETVLLLAKVNINTTTYKQEDANPIAFSSTNYWKDDFTSAPHDLRETGEPAEGKNALIAAYNYGKAIGAEKGTLMTEPEARELLKDSANREMMYFVLPMPVDAPPTELAYWLGSAFNDNYMYFVGGTAGVTALTYDVGGVGVRPVIEISKDKVTKAQ